MHKLLVGVLTILFCGLNTTCVCAWNDRTHMAIAYLAFSRLTPEEQHATYSLLKEHPHYESFLAIDRPEACSEELWVFMRAAMWPDFVNSKNHREEYHRFRWHFINNPYFYPGAGDSLNSVQLTQFSPNIVSALDENYDILSERYPSPKRKAIALCWLIHLVGDVHQPLHCINLYSDRFPKGDQGGNQVAVKSNDKAMKLHAYWDNVLGEEKSLENVVSQATLLAQEFEFQVTNRNERAASWASWAQDSFEFAKKVAYLDGTLPLVQWEAAMTEGVGIDFVPSLDEAYQARALELSKSQVYLASLRLGNVLKEWNNNAILK